MADPSTISRPDSPGSDSDSVVSSAQTASRLGGSAGIGSLAGANYSALNLSSLGLSSSSQVASSSSLLTGFNAISTVLNNPKKRQHAIDPNSSRYGALPTHKEAEIKRQPKQSVQAYIDDVSKEWERYTKNRTLGLRGKAKTRSALEGQEGEESHSITAASTEGQAEAAEGSKAKLPPLSAVPQVFFDEEFNLGNPYTFDVVTEKYGSTSATLTHREGVPNGESSTVTSPSDHIEKLSHYSDLVEQHLLHEIATRSGSFFSALGTLQDLSQSSTSCISLIRSLRSDLVSISETQVKTGLRIVRKQDERLGVLREMEGVERIHKWCESKRMAELMVGQGEYEDALIVIEDLKRGLQPSKVALQAVAPSNGEQDEDTLLAQSYSEMEDAFDLLRIPAIATLLPELDSLQASVAQSLEAELVSLLERELSDFSTPISNHEWALSQRVAPLIRGLMRTQSLERALTASYRPILLANIRECLRRSLPTPELEPQLAALFDLLDDDAAASGRGEPKSGEAGAQSARRLREMDSAQFQQVLSAACEGLESGLRSIAGQEMGLLRFLDALARDTQEAAAVDESESPASDWIVPDQVPYALPQQLGGQLHACVEVSHILLARLISLRAASHAQLDLRGFLQVFNNLIAFAERTESISLSRQVRENADGISTTTGSGGMRRLVPLRSTLNNQSKEWLRSFHRTRLEQAARYVEEETWAPTEVFPRDSEVVQKLITCATEDPTDWVIDAANVSAANPEAVPDESDETGEKGSNTLAVPSVAANGTVDGDQKSYFVVPATLKVLHQTKDYVTTVINFERAGTAEIMSRMVEFLKQYNSRTCQVVLGAGAMRSAGLKNITAKHLALASQSLSLFIHLIPYYRECVRRHLPDERQATMLVEFDKLKRDFQEHQFEIHAKLVAIMGDRLSVHCRGLAAVNWNAPLPADDSNGETTLMPSKPISDLVKETTTLNTVLSRYLQANVVESVIGQVLDAIARRVGLEYAKVEVTREGGVACRTRMEKDVEYLDKRLGPLKGGNWDSESLRSVVSNKTPPPEPPAAPAKGSAQSTPTLAASATMGPSSQPGTPGSRPSMDGSLGKAAPAAYRSRLFPFGRGSNASNASLNQQATAQQQAPQVPTSDSPASTPLSRAGSQTEHVIPENQPDSKRASLELPPLPPSTATGTISTVPVEQATEASDAAVASTEAATKEPGATAEATSSEPALPLLNQDHSAEMAAASEASSRQESVSTEEGPALESSGQSAAAEPPAVETQDASRSSSVDSALTRAPATDPLGASTASLPVRAASPSGSPAALANSQPMITSSVPSPTATTSPASTAPPSGVSTPTGTAGKPARMTLQQRLAEASRKRAAATAAANAMPPPPPPTGGAVSIIPVPDKAQAVEVAKVEADPPPTPAKNAETEAEATPELPSLADASEIAAAEQVVEVSSQPGEEATLTPAVASIEASQPSEGPMAAETEVAPISEVPTAAETPVAVEEASADVSKKQSEQSEQIQDTPAERSVEEDSTSSEPPTSEAVHESVALVELPEAETDSNPVQTKSAIDALGEPPAAPIPTEALAKGADEPAKKVEAGDDNDNDNDNDEDDDNEDEAEARDPQTAIAAEGAGSNGNGNGSGKATTDGGGGGAGTNSSGSSGKKKKKNNKKKKKK